MIALTFTAIGILIGGAIAGALLIRWGWRAMSPFV